MNWTDVAGAAFCIAGGLIIAGAAGVVVFARTRMARIACPIACALILTGSVINSHSFARMDHRSAATALTLLHHLGGAAWIGGMLYLLLTLRHLPDPSLGANIAQRFSRMAMASVAMVVVAGAGLSYLYVGSPAALAGTTYGIMLASKMVLTAMVLLLGALNWRIVSAARRGVAPALLPLRRFAEAELGIGLTILLAAASLTSTPPAIDVRADLVTAPEIAVRMRPRLPRMQTPDFKELSPATPLVIPDDPRLPRSFVPGQIQKVDSPADIAWSEYNHHWAGLVVLVIGMLSLLARRFRWAHIWPLAFLGLAAFLFVRADSENWPLGPRGFWESFQVAEVAQHRFFVLLIIVFAVFEWAVQTGRIAPMRAGLVFPLVCAAGGALLLTHSHSLGNVKAEFFAEMSHLPLSILAVLAGWSRWLEIRLPPRGREYFVSWIWPVCFVLIGALLMGYRES
jgi:putative copper resistance protein D